MFGEKALELVRELKRTQDGNLPPYNEDGIRQVIEEMRSLFEQNQLEVRATTDGERGLFSGKMMTPQNYLNNAVLLIFQASSCDMLVWSATNGAF